jgi:ABC-type transporter Mla subunit MlaD
MNRNNVLFVIIGALAVIVAVLGYQNYQERKQPDGMQITVGRDGISIDKK